MALSEQDMIDALWGIPNGALLFVSYTVGRIPTDRAIREAQPAKDMGLNLRHYVGRLESVRYTRNDEFVMTVLCDNRCNERNNMEPPHYRSFNPSLGTLHSLEVIEA